MAWRGGRMAVWFLSVSPFAARARCSLGINLERLRTLCARGKYLRSLAFLALAALTYLAMPASFVAAESNPVATEISSVPEAAEPVQPSVQDASGISAESTSGDFNTEIYYKNKLELAFDTGWLFYNTPLILDPLLGDKFSREPCSPNYTLVPLDFSLRWQLYDLKGRSILRGNTDLTFTGSYTAIPKGPESRYAAFLTGVRYNFVQPNWRIAPYVQLRAGLGFTDAAQPYESTHHLPEIGQGQDFTFTFIFGGGVRYNFNSRYSVETGISYMHISNAYLSLPRYFNHAVNVFGPSLGLNVAL
jgi:opacity protein-like surface antigen